jgi:hypothetical protein
MGNQPQAHVGVAGGSGLGRAWLIMADTGELLTTPSACGIGLERCR